MESILLEKSDSIRSNISHNIDSDDRLNNESNRKISKSKFDIQKSKNLIHQIILADDNHLINSCNERIVESLISELNLYNVDIVKVSDGLDVIKIFLNNDIKDKIKLIITDENMDYFNGSEMIKFIRKVEKLNKLNPIKIASVSSEDEKRHKDYLYDCGANFVFSKPLSKGNVKLALEVDSKN